MCIIYRMHLSIMFEFMIPYSVPRCARRKYVMRHCALLDIRLRSDIGLDNQFQHFPLAEIFFRNVYIDHALSMEKLLS